MIEKTNCFGGKVDVDIQAYSEIKDKDLNIHLDDAGKQLISNPRVVAFIMKNTIEIFKDQSVDDIVKQLEEPSTDSIVPPEIRYPPTEYNSITDGTIRYDVLVDTTCGHICTVDIELQGNVNPGYELTTRGIYYMSRLISRQLGNKTGEDKYKHIHKVYSIWLCPKTRASEPGGVSYFKMQCVDNGAQLNSRALAGADMMEMIFVRAGQDDSEDIVKFVNGLYRDRTELDDIFDLQKEVSTYMSFFDEVEQEMAEKYAHEGRAEGRAEGRKAGLFSAYDLYVADAINTRGLSLAEAKTELIRIFGITDEEAQIVIDSLDK